MVDTVKEVSGFPVNELGEVITTRGAGSPNYAGISPSGNFPVAADGKSLIVVDGNAERIGGWKFLQDGRYTSASPLVIVSGVKTKIDFDLTQLAYSTGYGLTFDYDDTDHKFMPDVVGSVYTISLRAKFLPLHNGGSVDFSLESPSFAFNPIFAQTAAFNKISENFSTVTEMIFIDPLIISNGLEIYVTPHVSDVQMYDYSIMVQRTFLP